MTPTGQHRRDSLGGHALDLLRAIPDNDWTTEADLVTAAQRRDSGIRVADGKVLGLRNLRSAGVIIIRRHDEGHLLYARTPTGTDVLTRHDRRRVRIR